MPNALAYPASRPASSSMWMVANSSLTAAKRFQLWKPVVSRTKTGSSSPGAIGISVTDDRAAGALDLLAARVGPDRFGDGEEHPPQPPVALVVLGQRRHRGDHVAGAHPYAVLRLLPAV